MMVGHPSETKDDFQDLLSFVKQMRFERLGAFPYSDEEGTYSNKHYNDDIDPELKQARMDELMGVQERIAFEINEEKIGKTIKTVIDREEDDFYIGRTEYDSPEIDPEVLISKEQTLQTGQFYQIQITDTQSFDLIGKI